MAKPLVIDPKFFTQEQRTQFVRQANLKGMKLGQWLIEAAEAYCEKEPEEKPE